MYREDLNKGGWFSFNSTKEQWKSYYADKMFKHFFHADLVEKSFRGVRIDDELLVTNNLNFEGMSGKKVLVIGGGPSTKHLNEGVLAKYDYVFSCNHFYKNKFLRGQSIDLVLIGDEINLNNADFLAYLEEFSPVIGFEHSARRSTHDLVKFKRKYSKTFVFLTRYFSRLGYVPRACVIARCMGATQIDFIGLDGFKSQSHSFEKTKRPPSFNDEEKFKKQMKIFCNYMINDLCTPEINNLSGDSEDSIYKGLLVGVKNESK